MSDELTEAELEKIGARYAATREINADRYDRHYCMEDVPILLAELRRLRHENAELRRAAVVTTPPPVGIITG